VDGAISQNMGWEQMDQAGFYKSLVGQDDLGVIVRSHIYIEQEIIRFIEALLHSPKELKLRDFEYGERVGLALALGLRADLKAPLNFIGNLRNKFSHQLRASLAEDDAKNLHKTFSRRDKANIENSYQILRTHPSGAHQPSRLSDLGPKDRIVLYLIQILTAVIAETMRVKKTS
jgi:hypothetical protein